MTVTVKQSGSSLAVIFPRSVADELGLRKGSHLEVTTQPDAIMLRKTGRRPRRPLAELVKQIDPEAYRRLNAEFAADGPVGKEIW